jgi:CubicO group peptidase (beta-lactamase class C family)
MVLGLGPTKGTINSIVQFNRRIAPPGTKYFYASIEPDVLGVVLHYAVNQSASDYLREMLWERIGAEADATWVVDAEGFEVAHGFFNAVLRDYARIGCLLAYDGVWEGRQIIPAQYLIDATTTRPSDAYLAPGKAMPTFGYGYFLWLLPGARRQFALVGANGQRICVVDFKGDHGPDGCRDYQRGLATVVCTGRAVRPGVVFGSQGSGRLRKS